MTNPRRRTRALQIGFLALLAFSTAQVAWWVYDQSRLAGERRRVIEALYRSEARLGQELLDAGRAWADLEPHLEHLSLQGSRVVVDPRALAELDAQRLRRLRRYGAEGTFFMVVLLACMGVIWRTLRREAQLARRQENFLAAVSHEFKSPLASLQLSLDTIRMRHPGPERLAELVERMNVDTARLETLVSEVLDTAALESGRRPIRRQEVTLAEVAAETLSSFAVRAEAAGVDLAAEVDDSLAVAGDPVAVRTVLRNLVDNALRATAAAGGGTIRVAASGDAHTVTLVVADTGIGFPPAEATNLFQKFYRVGDELRRSTPGTGLGLYIVHRLMELQRGTIRAESAGPGRGATFTATWSRHRVAEEAEA